MKKMSLIKTIISIGLSVLLIINLVSVVRADDTTFGWDDPTSTNTAGTDNTSSGGNTSSFDSTYTTTGGNTSTVENTAGTKSSIDNWNTSTNSSIGTGNTITTLNTSTDDENTEVNSLAYTGIEDNGVLVVVILVGAIVAGYSLKKIRDYNI